MLHPAEGGFALGGKNQRDRSTLIFLNNGIEILETPT